MSTTNFALGASAALALSSIGCARPAVYPDAPGQQMAFMGQVSELEPLENSEGIASNTVRIKGYCNAEIPTRNLRDVSEGIPIASLIHGSTSPLTVRLFSENGILDGELQALPGQKLDILLKPGDFRSIEPDYHSITIYVSQDEGSETSSNFRIHFYDGDRLLSNAMFCNPIELTLP